METRSWLEQKEDDMPQKVSKYEQFFVDKGEKRGIDNTIMSFIQNRRKRCFSDMQIQSDLQLDFGLDEAKACQYMAAAAKA